ncbi:MAG: hypothetical protein KDI17_04200 [Halioglobus sp.]|nr:hypothetical protein [Halioglobus sp.]
MPWHYLNCGDPTLSDPAVQGVIDAFDRIHRHQLLPADAVIYSRHESHGDLHCTLVLYFNPGAAPVASATGATACSRPQPHGLSKLVSNPQA